MFIRSVTTGLGSLLIEVGRLNLSPCAVADVEHFYCLLFLHDAVFHTIDMRFAAIERASELVPLASDWGTGSDVLLGGE